MQSDVTVWYVEDIDRATNVDKFYRAYQFEEYSVFQWGRRGTIGQFKAEKHSTQAQAASACAAQIDKKRRGGYTSAGNVPTTSGEVFTVKYDNAPNPTVLGRWLDAARSSAGPTTIVGGGQPTVTTSGTLNRSKNSKPPSVPDPPLSADRLEAFTSRALVAIGLVAQETPEGFAQFGILTEEFRSIEDDYEKAKSFMGTLHTLATGEVIV